MNTVEETKPMGKPRYHDYLPLQTEDGRKFVFSGRYVPLKDGRVSIKREKRPCKVRDNPLH